MNKKIQSLVSLSKIIDTYKKKNKKVVLCHGVFDLLHIGHIKHFQTAKKLGDVLVVTITADKHVNKGPNRPYFNSTLRLEALSALEIIDFVGEHDSSSAESLIKKLKPNIYCKGSEYKNHSKDITGKIQIENKAIKSVGGTIYYTDDMTYSSSKILKEFGAVLNAEQLKTVNNISKMYSYETIKKKIENFKKLNVLVIGETILDEYIFCEALGKSGKESVLAMKDIKKEIYLGGAAAISRHLSDSAKSVTLLSMLGEKNEEKKFINKNLEGNIKTFFINKKDSPTIVKRRFVDNINKNKVLGIYSLNDNKLDPHNEKKLKNYINKNIKKFDLVIVSDFGHGFISSDIANLIVKSSKFVTANAQINSSNIGHHTIDKYVNANCIIINESELRHELRSKDASVNDLIKKMSKKLKVSKIVVTRGHDGCTIFDSKKNSFTTCPAFATKVIDKIGSGDAMLALLSLGLKNNFDNHFNIFVSSLAAAQSVETIGNSERVKKVNILKTIKHIV